MLSKYISSLKSALYNSNNGSQKPSGSSVWGMASSVDNAVHGLFDGACSALNNILYEKKATRDTFESPVSPAHQKKDNKKDEEFVAVDFFPLVEKYLAIHLPSGCAQRKLLDDCLRSNNAAIYQRTASIDDTWGFVDNNDLSVKFKVFYLIANNIFFYQKTAPVKPPRRNYKKTIPKNSTYC